MSPLTTTSIAATMILLASAGCDQAVARGGSYPLTLCGPNLSQFCRIHGFFDAAPFRYSLAIHPGCIRWVKVETPSGLRRQRVLVCG